MFTDFGLHRHKVRLVAVSQDGTASIRLSWSCHDPYRTCARRRARGVWDCRGRHHITYANVPRGKEPGTWRP